MQTATKNPESIMLLLDSARGNYIPRDFVQGFDLTKFEGIKSSDAMICENPDHEWYWEAWSAILDNATFIQGGWVYRLYQDGDLFAYCDELMSDEEHENLFGEPRS
jgi:hypothetical protein